MELVAEIRSSIIHGRGVFAVRDIKEGEFVCIYDGELMSKTEIIERNFSEDKEYWMMDPTDSAKVLCGYKEPKDKLGIGQLVNDAKKLYLKNLDYKDGVKAVKDYDRESKELANVDLRENFKIYALRDILKDEELFLHYGYDYWIGFMLENDLVDENQFMWRLLCFCLSGEVNGVDGTSLNIREALVNSDDKKCREIIEMIAIPSYVSEKFDRFFQNYSFVEYLWMLLKGLKIDCIETYLER